VPLHASVTKQKASKYFRWPIQAPKSKMLLQMMRQQDVKLVTTEAGRKWLFLVLLCQQDFKNQYHRCKAVQQRLQFNRVSQRPTQSVAQMVAA
jgi:hypothetical protein